MAGASPEASSSRDARYLGSDAVDGSHALLDERGEPPFASLLATLLPLLTGGAPRAGQAAASPAAAGGPSARLSLPAGDAHLQLRGGNEGGKVLPPVGNALPDVAGAHAAGNARLEMLLTEAAARATEGEADGVMSRRSRGPLELFSQALPPPSVTGLEAAPRAGSHVSSTAPPQGNLMLGQPNVEQPLAQRVAWMLQQGVGEARVRVEPESLGPIVIRVRLEGDAVQVSFHSAHAPVREVLVEAVPRLRELLGNEGMTLADVDVGARHEGEPRDDGREPHAADATLGPGTDAPADHEAKLGSAAESVMRHTGLIDAYA